MRNNTRILQVSTNDLYGNKFNGHDLHNHLANLGYDSNQLVWSKTSNDKKTFIIGPGFSDRDLERDKQINIQKKYSIDSFFNPISLDILYDNLFLNSDLVHYHLINDYIFDLAMLPLMTKLKPTVWTIHDPWPLGGHCVHHFDCNKWQNHCFDCPYLGTHFSLKQDNSALNFVLKKDAIQRSSFDAIVASRWMKEKLEKSPIFQGKKIHLVPFGIDQNVFYPKNKQLCKKDLGIDEKYFVITFRYEESEYKGIDYIVYALNNIQTNKEIMLLITGSYKNNSNFKFKHKFKNFGWVNDDGLLAKIYSASDLLLMPSKVESFGMMAAEAMCCGCVPVVLNGSAISETVSSPDIGLSTNNTYNEYSVAVNFLIKNEDERILRSNRCVEFSKKYYSLDRYVKSIADIYDSLIYSHKLSLEDRHLLSQLKKHMVVKSNNSNEIYMYLRMPLLLKIVRKILRQIRKLFPKRIIFFLKNLIFKR